LKISVKELKGS